MVTFSAQQIAGFLSAELIGDSNVTVSDIKPIEQAQEGALCFVGDERFAHFIPSSSASIIILSRSLYLPDTPTSATLIIVDNARAAMAQLLNLVSEALNPRKHGIEQPCFIASGTLIDDSVYIGAFAYIGENVLIGKNVEIYPNCYIGDNCVIGDNTTLYAGVKVYHHSHIGSGCILHSGVVIGADGFGFEPDAQAVNRKVPQIGNVVIEDDVEIGANTTIDRAMIGSTIIHRNVKIDNLVQVAHNVEVGESTILCAQVGIAGSSKIGSHCILAGQTGVAGHLEIADNCIFGAQTGIPGSIKKAGTYMGYPAIDAALWRRAVVSFKQLPDLQKIIYKLRKILDETTYS